MGAFLVGEWQKIAFATDRDGTQQIYVMNADGSDQTRITNDKANDWAPSFSPDGKKIAFVTDRASGPGVYIMEADGSNQLNLTNSTDSTNFAPAFSTDGSRIAFVSDRDGNPSIYIINADGSGVAHINHNGASDNTPAWCLAPSPHMLHAEEVRRSLEQREAALSPYAAKSSTSRGRERPEQPSPVRLDFQRDRDRIIHCKSFRRLKHKTQVFVAPAGDHYVTRLTHTLEVAQIARTIARALNLNEDLTEAIALGHDLGHTPFGHRGEDALAELLPEGFSHNEQSLRVVELLERGGKGLNLTWEVRDGILHHSKSREGVMASRSGPAGDAGGADCAHRRHHRLPQPRHRRRHSRRPAH